jgi:hypothetical protein
MPHFPISRTRQLAEAARATRTAVRFPADDIGIRETGSDPVDETAPAMAVTIINRWATAVESNGVPRRSSQNPPSEKGFSFNVLQEHDFTAIFVQDFVLLFGLQARHLMFGAACSGHIPTEADLYFLKSQLSFRPGVPCRCVKINAIPTHRENRIAKAAVLEPACNPVPGISEHELLPIEPVSTFDPFFDGSRFATASIQPIFLLSARCANFPER